MCRQIPRRLERIRISKQNFLLINSYLCQIWRGELLLQGKSSLWIVSLIITQWITDWSLITLPISFSLSFFVFSCRLIRASKTFLLKMQQDLPRKTLTTASAIFSMPLPQAATPPGLYTSRSWHLVRQKIFHLIHLILPRWVN